MMTDVHQFSRAASRGLRVDSSSASGGSHMTLRILTHGGGRSQSAEPRVSKRLSQQATAAGAPAAIDNQSECPQSPLDVSQPAHREPYTMTFIRFAALPLILCLPALVVRSAAADIAIHGSYWLASPAGDAAFGIEGVEGTSFDVEDDLGFDEAEGTPGIALVLGDTHQLGLSYLQFDATAQNEIERTIQFQDLQFRVSADVTSTMEATVFNGYYQFNFGEEQARAGLRLGGYYVDFSASTQSDTIGRAYANIKAGLPVIGAHVRFDPLPYLSLRGALSGSSWSIDDIEATVLDAEGYLVFQTEPGFLAAAGYRHLAIDAEDESEPVTVDLTFSGPVLLVGFEW